MDESLEEEGEMEEYGEEDLMNQFLDDQAEEGEVEMDDFEEMEESMEEE